MEKEYKMSQARKDELEQELNYLKTTRSDEVAEQIKIARGFGDLSENSEYDEAKNEQGKLYSRIAELEVILQHVVIVDESAASDTITIGCTVTVQGTDGKEASYKIVGSQVGGRFLRLNHPYFPLLSRFSPCKNAVGCAIIKCMNLKPGSGCRPALTNLPHFLYSMDLLFC